ncbi:DUF3392 family protein [Salinispirillum marinum]|uniref:DUF3392 family protein n=2 Tax=Saccharospirillaceae TaxID=255527 RepID=A0ABV8BFK5_9GAMM
MQSLLIDFSNLFAGHLRLISSAIVATVLVIFGQDVNRAALSLVKRAHFLVRTTVFILLCAVGYGYLTVQGGLWLAQILRRVDHLFLGVGIVLIFVVLGVLAERRAAY